VTVDANGCARNVRDVLANAANQFTILLGNGVSRDVGNIADGCTCMDEVRRGGAASIFRVELNVAHAVARTLYGITALRGGGFPDLVVRADAGPPGAPREGRGAEQWGKGAIAYVQAAGFAQPALVLVDGAVGLVLAPRGKLSRALKFTIKDGKISQIEVITGAKSAKAAQPGDSQRLMAGDGQLFRNLIKEGLLKITGPNCLYSHRRSAQRSRRVLSDSHDHGARVFAAREPEVHHVYSETEQRGPDHHARPHEVQKGDTGYRQALQLERGL
jgi:hypothetical protein